MAELRVPLEGLREGTLRLPEAAARYVARVHRLGPGGRFTVFDPAAKLEAEATVIAVDRGVEVRLDALRPATHVARLPITWIQAVGKGAKVDAVVRDATELGATEIVIALGERSVKRGGDPARWRRVAVEAARQCGRGDLPTVTGPVPLAEAFSVEADARLLLDARGGPMRDALAGDPRTVALAVGPEGGFSLEERSAAERAGFVPVRLGPFVMRTETACAAALGAVHAWLG